MPTVQLGQHAPAARLIVHISDTHYLAGKRALYGTVDTDHTLERALVQLERTGLRPAAIVLTGDIADRGEAGAYRRIRDQVEETAARLGATVVWVMGNHDERSVFRTELLREVGSSEPVDRVYDLGGLRIIALDTSVPGFHHGEVSEKQREWLADVLSTEAEFGSVLALHHPPVPTPLHLMNILELRDQPSLAAVIAGSDIRAVLGGHLHYATTGMFAGVPVSVAAATCYTMDLSAPARELTGVDGGQSINLVHVYEDQVTHSVVPIGAFDTVTAFESGFLDRMESISADERTEAFSRQVL